MNEIVKKKTTKYIYSILLIIYRAEKRVYVILRKR